MLIFKIKKFLLISFIFLFLNIKSNALATFSFEIKSVQPNLVSSKNQEVEVLLDIKDLPSESYFRVGWQRQEGGSYFGYIKNNSGEWVKIIPLSGDCSNYFRVSQTGDIQITLLTKIGDEENIDSGEYLIRGHRFTLNNCTSTASINTQVITVNLPTPTPTLTLTPTTTPVPTSTQTLTPIPSFTPIPTNTPAPNSYSNIFISEFMANPESGDEWVELFNDNDFEVDIFGWYLDDEEGGHSPYKIISDSKIPKKSYKKFSLGSSAFLNNDGDDVRLLDGNQNEKDSTSFESSTKGKSWSKDNSGVWCETDPTPNLPNLDCPSSTLPPYPTTTPSLTPTKTPSPTKTPTPSLTLTPTPTHLEELNLMEPTSGNSSVLGAGISPTKTPQNKQKFKITAGIFIFSGLILLGISGFFLLREKLIQSKSQDVQS